MNANNKTVRPIFRVSQFGQWPPKLKGSNVLSELLSYDDRKVFSLDFNGELKLYKLGSVGASAGRFVIDNSNTLSEVPQIWGVATIETNFSFLEQFGLFMFAKGTFQLNFTELHWIRTNPLLMCSGTTPPDTLGIGIKLSVTLRIGCLDFLFIHRNISI